MKLKGAALFFSVQQQNEDSGWWRFEKSARTQATGKAKKRERKMDIRTNFKEKTLVLFNCSNWSHWTKIPQYSRLLARTGGVLLLVSLCAWVWATKGHIGCSSIFGGKQTELYLEEEKQLKTNKTTYKAFILSPADYQQRCALSSTPSLM